MKKKVNHVIVILGASSKIGEDIINSLSNKNTLLLVDSNIKKLNRIKKNIKNNSKVEVLSYDTILEDNISLIMDKVDSLGKFKTLININLGNNKLINKFYEISNNSTIINILSKNKLNLKNKINSILDNKKCRIINILENITSNKNKLNELTKLIIFLNDNTSLINNIDIKLEIKKEKDLLNKLFPTIHYSILFLLYPLFLDLFGGDIKNGYFELTSFMIFYPLIIFIITYIYSKNKLNIILYLMPIILFTLYTILIYGHTYFIDNNLMFYSIVYFLVSIMANTLKIFITSINKKSSK